MKAVGTNIDVEGWALVSRVEQDGGGYTCEYRGAADKLDAMKAYLYSNNQDGSAVNYFDSMDISIDSTSGVAIIRTNTSAITATTAERVPEDQTQQPTCVITGSMASPPIHQHPYFSENENADLNLTLEDIQAVEWCLKNNGIVTAGDIHATGMRVDEYARWRCFGIDTYLAPAYTMELTYYLKSSQKASIASFIKTAGKVWSLSSAIARLPASIQPLADTVPPAWLAQAPTINYTSNGITVSQSFVGAEKFPSFYKAETEALVYDAPALPLQYWRESKFRQLSSGIETTDDTGETA